MVSIIFPSTSVNLVRPTHRISRNQYCFPMSVAALGGPNWNVWGSLLNDLCRQGSQSDCKHMERFLRQEKHLYNAERETDRGTRERQERGNARERKGGKGSERRGRRHIINPLKRSDNLNLELSIRCGHASAETLSPDLHECLLCRICVSKSVFWFLFTAPSFRSSSSYFSPPSISLTTSLSLISYWHFA